MVDDIFVKNDVKPTWMRIKSIVDAVILVLTMQLSIQYHTEWSVHQVTCTISLYQCEIWLRKSC